MGDLDLAGLLSGVLPRGGGPASDPTLFTTGLVFAVNAGGRLVRVAVRDADLWLAAQPGRYVVGRAARVLLDPAAGRPVLVLGPLDPADPISLATVNAVSGTTVTVDWAGVGLALPAIPNTYTVGSRAWVSTDDWGQPVLVHGPSTLPAPSAPGTPDAPPPPTSGTQQVTVAVGVQWSGTYRHSRSAWDRWNTDRYGGRSTLYQGDGFGSGSLTGLAIYGDQIVNLGAISIDRVRIKVNPITGGGSALLQGAPHGSPPGGAPSPSGGTASGTGWVDLDGATREAMRVGSVKSIATVGTNYLGVGGAGNGDGMVAEVTFTRNV